MNQHYHGVYKFTQAIAHKFVMGVFKQHMNHLASYEKINKIPLIKFFTNLAMTTGVMIGACLVQESTIKF